MNRPPQAEIYTVTPLYRSAVRWSTHVGQVVVEVRVAGAEEAAEQGGVCGEHRGYVDLTQPRQDQTNTGQPLVEVRHYTGRVVAELRQTVTELCSVTRTG